MKNIQTKIGISAPQASRRLRNLWADRVNVHNYLVSLAQDIEMYGEIGKREEEMLEVLYLESKAMTESLKWLLEGVRHDS